jgi:hypothetical protein
MRKANAVKSKRCEAKSPGQTECHKDMAISPARYEQLLPETHPGFSGRYLGVLSGAMGGNWESDSGR